MNNKFLNLDELNESKKIILTKLKELNQLGYSFNTPWPFFLTIEDKQNNWTFSLNELVSAAVKNGELE